MDNKVIIACDFDNKQKLADFLAQFCGQKLFLKLGMELIYSSGLEIINNLTEQGHEIFLDLKLHDITTTVIKTLHVLKNYPIKMVTVHLSVGKKTLQEITKVFPKNELCVLGVSVLTNLEDKDLQMLYLNPSLTSKSLTLNLANLADKVNLGGIICSAQESSLIKSYYPKLLTVCPGIRLGKNKDDQKRVVDPYIARNLQADYIVVGREITNSLEPVKAYQQIKKIFQGE